MRRTNTTTITTFNLPFPDSATFTFSSTSPTSQNAIRITIPPSGKWRMPFHWHPSENAASRPACESVTCISGPLRVYVAHGLFSNYDKLGYSGMRVKFKPGQRVAWNRTKDPSPDPLTVDLVADHALWRNICSAILDRDVFPQLSSTPWWLRALFVMLGVRPSWRNWLLSAVLWIQVQTIFYGHGVRVYQGYYVPVTWPWIMQPFGGRPPVWAKRLEMQSLYFITTAIMMAAYWTGRVFFGMKGNYVEYIPRMDLGQDKDWAT